jgi:hypothetical protein
MKESFASAGFCYHQFQAMSVEEIEFLLVTNCSPGDRLAIACLIDDETPFQRLTHFEQLLIMRTSLDRKLRLRFEHVLPWVFSGFPPVMSPLTGASQPRLAFCGFLSHPQRTVAIEAIRENGSITMNLLLRDRFWGGSPHDPGLIAAYEDNMRSCEYNLCLRGSGNFSMRLYHTLAAGRIPVVVRDETTLLPFEDLLNWQSFAVIAERPESLPQAVLRFHEQHDIVAVQRRCADVHRTWFDPSRYPLAFLRSLGHGPLPACP